MAATPHPRSLRLKVGTLLTLLLSGLSLGGCVDGSSPIDLTQDQPVALLSLAGDFTRSLADEGAAPINRIRVTATVVGTGEVVGQEILDVNPADPNWTVEIKIDIPTIPNPQVVLTVELINNTGGVETVEWSGQTDAIALSATTTAASADVDVVRGPVENLSVTAVAIIAPVSLRAGKTATLDATVATSASGSAPQLYWTSLTPEIGTVSATGVFTAVAPGTAQVQATAGAATDEKTIQVLPAFYKVIVEPTDAHANALGQELTFQAAIVDTEENQDYGEAFTWTVDDGGVLEHLGGGVFVSAQVGVAQVTATSVSEPSLSATVSVEVEQVAYRVDVTPSADTLTAVGATTQFVAEAYDANDNVINNALLAWISEDEAVATVDPTGLVTATGGGETTILAEVLDPDFTGAPSQLSGGVQGVEGGTGVYGYATIVVDLPLTLGLAPTNANIPSIGGTLQMVVTAEDGSGNKVTGLTFAWSSSDPNVATVDANGLVTSVTEGKVTITVTSGGVSATAEVTTKQEVAEVRWVQEPTDGVLWDLITPSPSVEVVDANGHRVEGFEGEVSLEATYVGCCLSPPAQPSSTSEVPEPNVSGQTTIAFVSGFALFDHIRMIDSYGYYQLTAVVAARNLLFYGLSVIFYMDSGY